MEISVIDKQIDESKQGAAFMPAYNVATPYSKKYFIESYGCAMNFADTEVIASILHNEGLQATKEADLADVVLINTCSIREKAEQTVRNRLKYFKFLKKQNPQLIVGILGCMAERLKSSLLEEEKLVDIVIGPDAYRSLPTLLAEANEGNKGINVLLSREETYADIAPVRLNSNGVTAFVSIMRGCNNMCSFCVVPFTRGRERSRPVSSILAECEALYNDGYREVTLLGQNVDSYHYINEAEETVTTFARLLEKVAQIAPDFWVRFSTSHPKDITDEVLFTMMRHDNICKYIHLPVQSGSSRMLELMNRTYSREWYLQKFDRIKELMPDCAVSTDMIAGFCTETEADHEESLSLFEYCNYDLAYLYYYSERPGTLAARKLVDDVPLPVKKKRLDDLVQLYRKSSLVNMQKEMGKTFTVLVEGPSKKDDSQWQGRNSQNKMIVFPKKPHHTKGSFIEVLVNNCTAGTLLGEAIN